MSKEELMMELDRLCEAAKEDFTVALNFFDTTSDEELSKLGEVYPELLDYFAQLYARIQYPVEDYISEKLWFIEKYPRLKELKPDHVYYSKIYPKILIIPISVGEKIKCLWMYSGQTRLETYVVNDLETTWTHYRKFDVKSDFNLFTSLELVQEAQ